MAGQVTVIEGVTPGHHIEFFVTSYVIEGLLARFHVLYISTQHLELRMCVVCIPGCCENQTRDGETPNLLSIPFAHIRFTYIMM